MVDHWFEPSAFLIAMMACIGAAAATVLGGLSVFSSKQPNPRILAFGLAFAGGAMVYVSLVEIFAKSQTAFIETFGTHNGYAFATLSFFVGIGLIMLIDHLIPNPHGELDKGSVASINSESERKYIANVGLLAALAITAHNFPEGMATFFATLDNPSIGTPLAIAIAVHNIPEGVSIAIPVFFATGSRAKAMLACTISAMAEPVGALLGYAILAPFLSQTVYGIIFGVIAGIMVFLAIDELLPAARRYAKGHETVYGIVTGMALLGMSLVLFKV